VGGHAPKRRRAGRFLTTLARDWVVMLRNRGQPPIPRAQFLQGFYRFWVVMLRNNRWIFSR
jgi:hypothetical protein